MLPPRVSRITILLALCGALALTAAPVIPSGSMVVALQAFLDDASEAALTQIWREAMTIPSVQCAMSYGARPHITFGSWLVKSNELAGLITKVAAVQSRIVARPIKVAPRVEKQCDFYLTPVDDGTLSNYHARIHTLLGFTYPPFRTFDLPGKWQQHLTMFSCSTASADRVMAVFARHTSITNARIERFGIVTFGPITTVYEFRCAAPGTLPSCAAAVSGSAARPTNDK